MDSIFYLHLQISLFPGGASGLVQTYDQLAMITIVAISGSIRKDSINTALIHATAKLAPADMKVELVSIADLPLYNMDLEADFPASAKAMKDAVRAADAVLFAVPEHNFSFPGVLKNAIDWGSRPYGDNVFEGKPVILQSASPGWAGGIRGQYQLHQVLSYLQMKLVRFPEVCVGGASHKFDENLNLTDPMAIENIENQLKALRAMFS